MASPYHDSIVLVTGVGRSGTTAIARALSLAPGLLWIEEPNFVRTLLFPFVRGELGVRIIHASLHDEGWRGRMKFCRSMATMYPNTFGSNGSFPIRPFVYQLFSRLTDSPRRIRRQEMAYSLMLDLMQQTLTAAGAFRWLIKEPAAITCLAELGRLFTTNAVFVCRSLYNIIASRTTKGFQATFDDAFAVCKERLDAAMSWPTDTLLVVSIEEVTRDPDTWGHRICEHMGLPSGDAVGLWTLSRTAPPQRDTDHIAPFSAEQSHRIEGLRSRFNCFFGRTLI